MKEILVTLKIRDAEVDLKLSGERKIALLLKELGEALRIDIPATARIQAEPAGRILNSEKCLLEQEVYNGSVLTII
ncbi:MAG: hypothetical protein IJN39_05805 [Clostridia bacterium]|nr:hypothetical protein [Clostridia bacterium]